MEDSRVSYNKIKKSALSLFSQKGFEGTTIKDIAAEAGLKPSSIYSHITSKEELFILIWNECIQRTLQSVQPLTIEVSKNLEKDSEKILYQYYTIIIKYFLKNKEEYLFLKQASFFKENYSFSENIKVKDFLDNDDNIEYFSEFFNELQQKNLIVEMDCKDLFFAYIGVIIACLEEALVYNIKSDSNNIDKFWSIFWRGIKK